MALLPNRGPPLSATHQPLDPAVQQKLKQALVDIAKGERLNMEMVQTVAQTHACSLAQVYAAMALDPNLVFDMQHDVLVAICVGACQAQGAIENLETLLRLRQERLQAGHASFEIVARHCLDMCAHSPVCLSRSAHGQAAHPRLKATEIPEIISTLCDPA
ncbi:MAG: hypothetical protein R3C68_11940 [Myxococcota bacterium]